MKRSFLIFWSRLTTPKRFFFSKVSTSATILHQPKTKNWSFQSIHLFLNIYINTKLQGSSSNIASSRKVKSILYVNTPNLIGYKTHPKSGRLHAQSTCIQQFCILLVYKWQYGISRRNIHSAWYTCGECVQLNRIRSRRRSLIFFIMHERAKR